MKKAGIVTIEGERIKQLLVLLKREKCTNGPNDAFGVVWAYFHGLCLPVDT